MEYLYDGTATLTSMEPLLQLASLPMGLTLAADGSGGFSGPVGASGSLTLVPEDPAIRLIWRNDAGEIVLDHRMHIWGDASSGEYWFPFGFLPCEGADVVEESSIDMADTICRAQQLLSSVSFIEDEDSLLAPDGREAAAVNYMRSRSGVTDPWIVSLAYPFELRIEDISIGDGNDLELELGELPPGLDQLGECALVQSASDADSSWCVRPVMCLFDLPCSATSKAVKAALNQLRVLGFSKAQIDRLDAIAAEVADEFAWGEEEAA